MPLVESGGVPQRRSRLFARVSLAAAAAALLAAPIAPLAPSAQAGPAALAAPDGVFNVVTSRSTYTPGDDELGAPTLYVTAGSQLTLTNLDAFAAHALTSDAVVPDTDTRLFESGVLNFRASAPVVGVPALPAGSYPFHCSVHEDNMHGLLVVQ